MKINLIKIHGVLAPASTEDEELLNKVKRGVVVSVEMKQTRNYEFHKKFMAMLNFAFEHFEPVDNYHKGVLIEKEFEQFRKDIVIMSGYYIAVPSVNGGLRLKAKSISFARMKQDEFEHLYNACFTVILNKIFSNYTKQDLEYTLNELLNFG